MKNVSEIVGSAGVEYVKVNLNFSAAFPVPAHPEGVNPFPEGDLITINIGGDENGNNSEPITIEKRSPVDFEVAFFSSFRPKHLYMSSRQNLKGRVDPFRIKLIPLPHSRKNIVVLCIV